MTDWKRKLLAFLHDPPSKALDIKTHGERSAVAMRQAGFSEDEIIRDYAKADHAAAAADRLPFPSSQASGLSCAFDGVRNCFHHPLGARQAGSALVMPFHAEFASMELGVEGEQSVQPAISDFGTLPPQEHWRARFFAHWRLWPKHATEKDYRLALLPADTRIPDHTIWTHMQVVSALAGCMRGEDAGSVLQPAFLKLQLGPVQEFIAAARSIRDLWSGSYLLSWLMAAGLRALAAETGPDAVIFPSLRGQPLFDLHWRDELWSRVKIGGRSVWDSLNWQNRDLLTPNLPNVFLAVVPADQAAELGRKVADAITSEWRRIAEAVWQRCEKAGLTADEAGITALERRVRFDAQVARFLSVAWQATPWPASLQQALDLAGAFHNDTPVCQARDRIQALVEMATRQMPVDHRDRRFYTNDSKTKLNNIGLGWSAILAFNGWALDAVRQTRDFPAANASGWQTGTFNNKDALTGRDEAVAGGDEWSKRARAANEFWPALFKKDDWVSASTLVKRVWHRAYLANEWGLDTGPRGFPMPNTRGVAGHMAESDCGDDETSEDALASEKYFAVLAFDGDEIGKWISGEKAPSFSSQLANYDDGSGNPSGALEYFTRNSDPDAKGQLTDRFAGFLKAQRPLSPSYHLQFSEALSNFALLCARRVVEGFHGRLIYAGGDDVVALLPADTALACAEALRAAFTGREVRALGGETRFHTPAPGFLCRAGTTDQQKRAIPFLVPGPAADCSVGIAIAHFKSPLQDVVREALGAEKRAKKQLGRSAVAVTLFKRSGETIEWGCQWESGGLELYGALSRALEADQLSAKFPYRLAELLSPYNTEATPLAKAAGTMSGVEDFPLREVCLREFHHVLGRQRGARFPSEPVERAEFLNQLTEKLSGFLQQLAGKTAGEQVQALIGLCQTVAFANRTRSEAAGLESADATSASAAPILVPAAESATINPESA
jgi:CRISPR-associated protein Cas10/Cmr2 subtype III-B